MVLKVKSWADEIAEVTGRAEYQTCTVKIVDRSLITRTYDPDTDKTTFKGLEDAVIYEGQARYIPVRAGVPVQGEAQANANTLRAGRFQIPHNDLPCPVRPGVHLEIVSAPFNLSLEGRTAKVIDDFHGSTSATRTINVMMDIDSEMEEPDDGGDDGEETTP